MCRIGNIVGTVLGHDDGHARKRPGAAALSRTGPASRDNHATIAYHITALESAERALYRTLASEAGAGAGIDMRDAGHRGNEGDC